MRVNITTVKVVGWLVGWSVGWLVGWLFGWLGGDGGDGGDGGGGGSTSYVTRVIGLCLHQRGVQFFRFHTTCAIANTHTHTHHPGKIRQSNPCTSYAKNE